MRLAPSHDSLDRRTLLSFLVLGAGTALVGCSTSPTVHGASTTSVRPSPSPPPAGLDEGVRAEALALAWCQQIGAKGYQLPAGLTANLPALTAVHRRRLAALSLPGPTGLPSGTPSAGLEPDAGAVDLSATTAAQAVSQLTEVLGTVAREHRERALTATGAVARMWASLAAGAAQSARVVPRTHALPAMAEDAAVGAEPTQTGEEALAALLGQLHGLVYGCQVALTGITGADAERLRARLNSARLLRDDVTTALRRADASPPAAAPAYEISPPSDSAQARGLVRAMEDALAPWLGSAVAAVATEPLRRRLIDALIERSQVVIDLGGAAAWWPGYPG